MASCAGGIGLLSIVLANGFNLATNGLLLTCTLWVTHNLAAVHLHCGPQRSRCYGDARANRVYFTV